MRLRAAASTLLFVLPLLVTVPAVAQPKATLVVTGYGGRWSEVMKKHLTEPFEKKHNVKVEIVTGITTEWVAKLMAAGPENPPFDVIGQRAAATHPARAWILRQAQRDA